MTKAVHSILTLIDRLAMRGEEMAYVCLAIEIRGNI